MDARRARAAALSNPTLRARAFASLAAEADKPADDEPCTRPDCEHAAAEHEGNIGKCAHAGCSCSRYLAEGETDDAAPPKKTPPADAPKPDAHQRAAMLHAMSRSRPPTAQVTPATVQSIAQRHGYDPADVARSAAALGFGPTKPAA